VWDCRTVSDANASFTRDCPIPAEPGTPAE
jgi:hypothetical protein